MSMISRLEQSSVTIAADQIDDSAAADTIKATANTVDQIQQTQSTLNRYPAQQQVKDLCCIRTLIKCIIKWIVKIVSCGCWNVCGSEEASSETVPPADRSALSLIAALRQRAFAVPDLFSRRGENAAASAEFLRANPDADIPEEYSNNDLADALLVLLREREPRICGEVILFNTLAGIGRTFPESISDEGIGELRNTVSSMGDYERNLFMSVASLIAHLNYSDEQLNALMTVEEGGIGDAFIPSPTLNDENSTVTANCACRAIKYVIQNKDVVFAPREQPAS